MSKYNHTVEIDNFASRRSRVPERQKIVKLNCVARALQTYVIKAPRGQRIKFNQVWSRNISLNILCLLMEGLLFFPNCNYFLGLFIEIRFVKGEKICNSQS